MDNKILVVDRYADRVRSKMGVSDAYLPDKDINMPDIIDVAELNVKTLLPKQDGFGEETLVYIEAVVVLECCILLCPSMSARLPKKESGPHSGHELYVNWDNKKIEFQDERDSYISKIIDLESPSLPSSLPSFTVTFPKRPWQGK